MRNPDYMDQLLEDIRAFLAEAQEIDGQKGIFITAAAKKRMKRFLRYFWVLRFVIIGVAASLLTVAVFNPSQDNLWHAIELSLWVIFCTVAVWLGMYYMLVRAYSLLQIEVNTNRMAIAQELAAEELKELNRKIDS